MKNTLLISDSPLYSSLRGAESNDSIIFEELDCDFLTCAEFNLRRPKYEKYIISNFASLSQIGKDFLSNKQYVTIAHDFLFTPSRNPGFYPDFKVDEFDLINIDFLNNSKKIFCQSRFQEEIFKINGFVNTYSWGGNLWRQDSIEKMVKLGKNPKNGRMAVIDDPYKGTEESAEFCRRLNLPVDKLPKMAYDQFIEVLSRFSGFCLIPQIIETFNRILIEAKMMNLLVLTNQYCGAFNEECFKFQGEELGYKMNEKRREIIGLLNNF